ncbi:MAG: hypothetical protein BM557_02185 [Flavobacterium sp. MedPE-SWcel]|uniref:hypothetical protein n=1 Tax=uncultured Flavobacterium sp. TaxID=165435 RepID=UPI0009165378|nr:hypothetical protein [uncultured Flavobacterium sp.]OIQ22207.1 MAG: hypothetical protein BM557_02185 [Flavobacterium sp. MedPE-SWcel]
MSSNTQFNDRVRYTLKNKNLGSEIITEPIGWNDDDKEYSRHKNYHGIIAKFSNSLKFIGTGADYIQMALDLYGINEELELTREERHPHTDQWTLIYSGYLDLSTWVKQNDQVSVKFNSGGLEQLLKSRERDKIEIDRLTSIDGGNLPVLQTVNVKLEGRRIFLKSELVAKGTQNYVGHSSRAGDTGSYSSGIPFEVLNKSHEQCTCYFRKFRDKSRR